MLLFLLKKWFFEVQWLDITNWFLTCIYWQQYYNVATLFKGCIYLVLFFLYNYESDLVRGAERTAFCAVDFFSPLSLSGHITKTAKLADCQPNAPVVAQIYVIPLSPGSSSLTFKHSDIFSRNSLQLVIQSCYFRIVRVQVFNEPYADVVFSMTTRLTEDWHPTFGNYSLYITI